jgi:hypothetical protein
MAIFGGWFVEKKSDDKPFKPKVPGAFPAKVQEDPRRHLYDDSAKEAKEAAEPGLDVYRNILSKSQEILRKASIDSNWIKGSIKTPKDYVLRFTPEPLQAKYGMKGIDSSMLINADLSDLFQELVFLFDDEDAQKKMRFGKQSIMNMMIVILGVLDVRNQLTLDIINKNPRSAKILEDIIPEASNDF